MEPTGEAPLVHRAAKIDHALTTLLDSALRARGFSPRVIPYTGYGAEGWARVLARVVLVPPGSGRATADLRGWRRFAIGAAGDVEVTVRLGSHEHLVRSDRDGYLDLTLACDLAPGWQEANLLVEGADPVPVAMRIVAADTATGLISDLDDTVIVTMLPRPLVAFRNAFLVRESARDPVPGMAALYGDLVAAFPGLFVVYLSTGAWNTAGPMTRFLQRHGFPLGPLLMTDWGPTPDSWFRSGQRHKREQLRRLLGEFPDLEWVLVGDDGQHDPDLYAEAQREFGDRIRAVAIRQVPFGERAARGSSLVIRDEAGQDPDGQVHAPDGHRLREALAARGLFGVLVLALALVLGGCGGSAGTPRATPPSGVPTASTAPTPSATPTTVTTPTGPSGKTPTGRRAALGGCPAAGSVSAGAGTALREVDRPAPPLICSYLAVRTALYDGAQTPVLQLGAAEPVAIGGQHTLSGYKRSSGRFNATSPTTELGTGAFAAFLPSAPELCAVWFLARDGKILTTSALDIRTPHPRPGADGPACTAARRLAADFTG